jgi:predicted CXXCH cytochrome family protein
VSHCVRQSSSTSSTRRQCAGDSQRNSSPLVCILVGLLCLTVPACCVMFHDGRRLALDIGPGWPKSGLAFRPAKLPALRAELPIAAGADYVMNDQKCVGCHRGFDKRYQDGVHQSLRDGHSCEACHGPASRHVETRGTEPGLVLNFKTMDPVQRSEACSACHETNACGPNSDWRTSVHAHAGISCTDCHTIHSQRANDRSPAEALKQRGSLGAEAADLCFRCHTDMVDLQRIAGPHQIGAKGFQCIDCHDPLGMVRETSRQDLCLTCHQQGSPTMAWHSSMHSIAGVACTDCHNPHPRTTSDPGCATGSTAVSSFRAPGVERPSRKAMSVQQPEACYKCHPKIFAMSGLPSHHPIQEGKMVCSDCHDAHGQAEKGLREPTLNDVCYRCHGDKQGPFTYDHPPATEDCSICHQVHGSINDHLLHQPASFLCLRCHAGHRSEHRPLDGRAMVATQQALYGDCMQCHTQVHGSDLINQTLRGRGLTR